MAGEDPIGRTFRFAFSDRTVVGVVGDVRVRGLEQESEPQVYVPHRQVEDGGIIGYIPKDLAIRSTVPMESLLPAVRRIVAAADPAQPISDVRPLADVVAGESAPRAVQLRLLGAFAAIAVLLAGLGIHGLLAFSLAQRFQEIGVRRALGAGGREIVALIVGQGRGWRRSASPSAPRWRSPRVAAWRRSWSASARPTPRASPPRWRSRWR